MGRHDPDKPLTPAVYHTLLALAEGPLHGYAISKDVEEATEGQLRMGPGTLYGTLQRMQKAGLLEEAPAEETDAVHAGRRRYYRLTAEGREALARETARLERAVRLARSRAVLGNG